jgi:hypothetical protein
MKEEFPAQCAMAFLGFAMGLRPSALRPLRRSGPTPDVLLDEGKVNVDHCITFDHRIYSVPYALVDQAVAIRATVSVVAILHRGVRVRVIRARASTSPLR